MENIYRHISRITAVMLMAVMLFSTAAFYAGAMDEETSIPVGTEGTESVTMNAVHKSGRELTLEWTGPNNITDAASCYIYKNGGSGIPVSYTGSPDKLSYTFTDLEYNTQYTFKVAYFNQNDEEIVRAELTVTSAVEPPQKRAIGSFTINNPARLLCGGAPFNLRNYAGESYDGCSIVQGSCVDNRGEYSYYCLRDSSDYGKIVKVRMSDNACVGVSNRYYFAHGNGMCFDSKRNRVVVASYINDRKTLTFVNPDNLNDIVQKNVTDDAIKSKFSNNQSGITALAYNAKYDCYLAMQRAAHNIIIYDAESLDAKAASLTTFGSAYPGTFQSVDADDTYVYFLLSKDGSAQPNNVLVAFDWHAEKYEALLNGEPIDYVWLSGTDSGPSAVITINGANEIESLYHTDAGGGRGHFYLVNYDNAPTYKTTTTKTKWKKVWKKVKVKWKKVWKKVKWKKVKKNGKTKWKYKKKKVWKYKKKKKKVWKYKYKTSTAFSHYDRDSFVMDLGVF